MLIRLTVIISQHTQILTLCNTAEMNNVMSIIPQEIDKKKTIIDQYLSRILNEILTERIQQYIKTIIYHNHMGFTPGMQMDSIFKNQNIITLTV